MDLKKIALGLDPVHVHQQAIETIDKLDRTKYSTPAKRAVKMVGQLDFNVTAAAIGITAIAREILVALVGSLLVTTKLVLHVFRALTRSHACEKAYQRLPGKQSCIYQTRRIAAQTFGVGCSLVVGALFFWYKGAQWNVTLQRQLGNYVKPSDRIVKPQALPPKIEPLRVSVQPKVALPADVRNEIVQPQPGCGGIPIPVVPVPAVAHPPQVLPVVGQAAPFVQAAVLPQVQQLPGGTSVLLGQPLPGGTPVPLGQQLQGGVPLFPGQQLPGGAPVQGQQLQAGPVPGQQLPGGAPVPPGQQLQGAGPVPGQQLPGGAPVPPGQQQPGVPPGQQPPGGAPQPKMRPLPQKPAANNPPGPRPPPPPPPLPKQKPAAAGPRPPHVNFAPLPQLGNATSPAVGSGAAPQIQAPPQANSSRQNSTRNNALLRELRQVRGVIHEGREPTLQDVEDKIKKAKADQLAADTLAAKLAAANAGQAGAPPPKKFQSIAAKLSKGMAGGGGVLGVKAAGKKIQFHPALGIFEVDGDTPIVDINEEMQISIPLPNNDATDTISDFIFGLHGGAPPAGTEMTNEKWEFTIRIIKVTGQIIELVHVDFAD